MNNWQFGPLYPPVVLSQQAIGMGQRHRDIVAWAETQAALSGRAALFRVCLERLSLELFDQRDRQGVFPQLAVVGFDATDDREDDHDDPQSNGDKEADEDKPQEEGYNVVDDQRDDEVGHHLAVRVDRGHLLLLDLPDDDWRDQSSHRNDKSGQRREMQDHGPHPRVFVHTPDVRAATNRFWCAARLDGALSSIHQLCLRFRWTQNGFDAYIGSVCLQRLSSSLCANAAE